MTARVLTVSEAANMVGRSRDFIRALIADNLVAGEKVRGRWYVTEAGLREWARLGARDPQPARPVFTIPAQVVVRGRRAC